MKNTTGSKTACRGEQRYSVSNVDNHYSFRDNPLSVESQRNNLNRIQK